jgi:putative peptidoglycan lipid II flippase
MMIGLTLSKITGQLREILIPPVLGYGTVSDAFIIGFQIPDLFYQLLIGGAIQAAITPTLSAALEQKQEKQGWRSISIFLNLATILMLFAVVTGMLLSPYLIRLYGSSDNQATTELAVRVTRALFPQVVFMMLAAFCIGILNAYKKFASTSFGPSFYNICVILAMVTLGAKTADGAVRVATGVMMAALAFFLMQFILARREFKSYAWSFDFRESGFLRLVRLAVPTLISGSIIQVNMIILTAFANRFDQAGVVTSLRHAMTIWQLPYGIIAVAIGNVMLPSLARFVAARDRTASRRLYAKSLRNALYLTIPMAALILAMPDDVVRAIFQWNADYGDAAVLTTSAVLRWYCLAMVAQTVVFVTNQAFYARKITRIALYNGLLTLGLNTLFCFIFSSWAKIGVGSLSLAYTLTSVISSVLLYLIYSRGLPGSAPKRIWPFLVRCSICVSALILVLIGLNLIPYDPAGKIAQLFWLGLRALIGLSVYLGASILLHLPEARGFADKLSSMFARLPLRRGR